MGSEKLPAVCSSVLPSCKPLSTLSLFPSLSLLNTKANKVRSGSCSVFDPACQTQETCSPLASQNVFVIQVIVKKFVSRHSIICNWGFSVYWGLIDHATISMTKSDRSVDGFRFSVQITLVFSGMVLVLKT